ncbi:MAG: PEP-CTERM sorting domain-containing protein [Phycisphaerae bacterium]|nr:PEP-CTERM sorting domain-containing protein [Phycisphaerae bacterium]
MRSSFLFTLAFVAACSYAASASAQVGEPTGFEITITHGATVVAHETVTVGPGGDLEDIKATWQDGDPEGFVQIGTLGVERDESPLIMKVITNDDPFFRLLSMFINAPLDLSHLDEAGPNSLFDPNDPDRINVTIENMTFDGTTYAQPFVVNNMSFFVAFMRDEWGQFYELPEANAYNSYGHGSYDIQVPGVRFLDANGDPYLVSTTPGPAVGWSWSNIPNPGPNTTVHNGMPGGGGQQSAGDGYVFELGLAMAFVGVPEPSTVSLLLGGVVLIGRRRRVRG